MTTHPITRLASTLALASAAVLAVEGAARAQAADGPLDVVASFSVLGDLARRVGGDRVAVATLVGAGEDAHVYEPSPTDAARVAKADVVIVNGLEFEGFIDRLIEASGTRARIVTATDGVDPLEAGHDDGDDHAAEEASAEHDDHDDDRDDHHHGEHDPHAWHSVDNVRTYVANIADGFCEADPEGCDTYRANAETYAGELDALAAELDATLGAIPQDRRTLIVSHDAFGYLADAYGLTFLAPQGLSTESEASAADVARLIDQVRQDGASALFVENVSDPRLVERIAAETGLAVGGTLYSDALSPADGPAATYIDMMRHNADTVAGAVTGS